MVDSAAYAKLTEHVVSLRHYASSLTRCRHEAEDLVQECLTRAISAASTLRTGVPVRPWLFRILHNEHVSRLRRHQSAAPAIAPPTASSDQGTLPPDRINRNAADKGSEDR